MSKKQIEIIKKIEAEARIKKPKVLSSRRSAFLNKERSGGVWECMDPCVVLSVGSPMAPGGASMKMTNLATGSTVGTWHPELWNMNLNNSPIARLGTKVWVLILGGTSSVDEIKEFDIVPVNNPGYPDHGLCVLSYIRTITIPNLGPVGLTAKDSNTLIMGSVQTSLPTGDDFVLMEVDISSNVAALTPLFSTGTYTWTPAGPILFSATGGPLTGDLVYIPSSNTIVASITDFSSVVFTNTPPYTTGAISYSVIHYSYSGAILGQASLPAGVVNTFSMFCYGGQVYVSSSAGHQLFDLTNYTLSQASFSLLNSNDKASSSSCCDPSIPTTSTECYDIGDTGPEGGTIFAVPLSHPQNNGVNQTNFYYEVAQDDIAIAGTPQGNPAWPLFGPAGFNQTCGEETFLSMTFNTYVGVSQGGPVGGSVNINDNVIEIDTSYVTNSQFLAAINNGSISVGTMVNGDPTGPYMPVPNIFPTSSTPLITPGPAITHIVPLGQSTDPNVITLIFNELIIANTPSPWTGGLIDVRFYYLATAPGWSVTGAEWGVHNKPFTQTSLDFDTGHHNTDNIHNYPSLPGIHPWLDTHDIAATLSKQYGSTNDWFLPSYWEFREMVDNVGPAGTNQLGLNTITGPGNNSEHYYWTSSNRLLSNTPLPDADKYAWAYNTDTDDLELAYRCHALSVRPIRRFECVPCSGCDCVEYNYRDGQCGTVEGSFCSSCNDGSGGAVSATDWTTTTGGTQPGTMVNQGDSVMGGQILHITLNSWDVMSNQYTMFDFLSMGTVKISLWDVNYNFMGIWQYELGGSGGASDVVGFPGSNNPNFGSYDNPGPATRGAVYFHNPQHLEGDYPTVWYGGNGSSTGIFMKLEWSGAVSYETGCNSTIFGNPHPHNTPGNEKDWPFYCGPLYDGTTDGTFTGLSRVIPRYATTQPNDVQGNPITVHPTALLANPNYNMLLWPPIAQFSDMLNTGACEFCDYDIGDIGPAGGIIVATPNSPNSTYNASQVYGNVGDTGSNDSDYYYELSPVDLNDPTASHPNAEWGNFESPNITNGIDLTSVVDNGGILSVNALNNGEINTTDLMTTNPTANLYFPGGPGGIPSAPELCDSYSLNGYDDWFLPSVHEWSFVRNNIPSISTGPTRLDNFYWTSNFWDTGVLGNNTPVTSGPFSCTVMGNIPPGSSDGTYSEFSALVVDVNTPSVVPPTGPGPEIMWWYWVQNGLSNAPYPEYHLAYHVPRWLPSKVRSMRRFECLTIPPNPIYGCTNLAATNYDPLANIDDGSCVYPSTGTAPCFSVCAIEENGSWGPGWNWTGPIAMENNPLGYTTPPFGNAYPLPPQDFTAFYDWALSSIPTLVPGDTFIIDMNNFNYSYQYLSPILGHLTTITIMTGYSAMCLKYEGQQGYAIQDPLSTPLYFTNHQDPVPTITPSSCCVSSPVAGGSLARIGNFDLQDSDGTIDSVNFYIKAKQPKSTGPFGIFGYYPLYDNVNDAIKDSPNSSYHIHDFEGQEYYMPNGLEMGKTQFHGDYDGQIILETMAQPEVKK